MSGGKGTKINSLCDVLHSKSVAVATPRCEKSSIFDSLSEVDHFCTIDTTMLMAVLIEYQ